jgi:hypothetical protein
VADRSGCTHDEADDVLAKFVQDGELDIIGDSEDVYLAAAGTVLVHAKRDWLAFHAAFPGHDPMRDERRVGD